MRIVNNSNRPINVRVNGLCKNCTRVHSSEFTYSAGQAGRVGQELQVDEVIISITGEKSNS